MATGTRKPGDFCWINLLTPHPEEARAFFSAVLGWTYAEIPGLGHRIVAGGRNIGGLFDLDGPNVPPGTAPFIGVMIKVESADAAYERVRSLGGAATPPFDVMDQGRMAVCTDPSGARFDVWEPRKGQGTDADTEHHGAPSAFENMANDVDRAVVFYSRLFGWTAERAPIPGTGRTYITFKLDDVPVAGMLGITPEMGDLQPHWGTYFTVGSADEAVRTAFEHGGHRHRRMIDATGVGRFGGITSPQGVSFLIIEHTR